MTTTAGAERLGELRASFSGDVLQPDDAGYEDARRIHNAQIDRRPALIARCQNTADIADALGRSDRGGIRLPDIQGLYRWTLIPARLRPI